MCVHSRMSVWFALALVCMCAGAKCRNVHTALFDPELALQLPDTQQKASYCMSCVFPRRARAQREKGPRSLSPHMDVIRSTVQQNTVQKDWP